MTHSAIWTNITPDLNARYEVPQDLPPEILALLVRLNDRRFSKYLLVLSTRPQATEAVGAARLIANEHYQPATMNLQRAVHSAQRPSDAEDNQSARVRLGRVRHPRPLPAYEKCHKQTFLVSEWLNCSN
jgi:hypothetical protein